MALEITLSSWMRAATVDSQSADVVMQSVLAVFEAASASFNFFTTVAKSPSAVAYPSVEASLTDLSLLTSLVSASICSSRLCFIIE